ncbi:MAG: hypothetical protein MUP63_04145, partial [Candidatus Nanohaloarchaeota archaeon QJJ-7]|nr:hypothetical protein [Candidatus Nanohaloarchaeota archaeon QJJ-7]
FEASGFSRAPFDAAARDKEERFVGADERKVEESLIEFLERLGDLAGSSSFLVTERDEEFGSLSSISERKLKRLDEKEEFKEEVN